MKKIILSLLVVTFASTAFADEYVYSCAAGTNLKIFAYGNSQNIAIELNSGYLSIRNDSGFWNSLAQEDELDGSVYFKSIKTDNQMETLGLVAIADSTMLKGAKQVKIVLIKDINTQGLTQDYNCNLVTVRH
jgi:hypothetical protein